MKLRKKKLTKLNIVRLFALVAMFGVIFAQLQQVHAAFNPNNLIDDAIFDNTGTMNAGQIDAMLNTFPNSCISPNSGFSAPDPNGYSPSSGYKYGSNVSAGQVIYDAAQAYGLNPQVLITTLQKEEGLVAGNGPYGCSPLAISASLGYGCPDEKNPDGSIITYSYSGMNPALYYRNGEAVTSVSNTCVNGVSKAGFSQQIIHATWLFKFGEQRSKGNTNWAVIKGNWDNSDDLSTCYGGPMTQGTLQRCPNGQATYFDGYTVIDSASTHMDTGATAALYWYTPHFHGNQIFDTTFGQWFGSVYAAPYVSSYYSQSTYPHIVPGQSATAYLTYQNSGNAPWYDNQGLSSAPAGTAPVHLSTSHELNHQSGFGATWPTTSRPALNFSAVYNSDGVTLSANQHVATAGQIVKFSFNVTVAASVQAGTYVEYFQPVLEGSTSQFFNDPGTFLNIIVDPVKTVAYSSQSAYPTIAASTSQIGSINFVNTGNIPLYDDKSVPSGSYPTHLAVSCPLNSTSDFSATWPTTSRPALNFSAVYNPDGTLSGNQHVAGTGQIVKFSFSLTSPISYPANVYKLCLQPVLEGTSGGTYSDIGAFLNITVPSSPAVSYDSTPSYTITSGEEKSFSYTIKNTGNSVLAVGSKVMITNGSDYADPYWSGQTVATTSADIAVGASDNVNFNLLAPIIATAPRTDMLNFKVNNPDGSTTILGSSRNISVQVIPPDYSTSYVSQSSYPSLNYGEAKTVFFRYKNTGNKTWFDDTSVSTASVREPKPTHLATAMPLNRSSGFADNWPSSNRPALTFSKVLNSDNSTLTGNQHVVQPGQIGEFSFTVAAQAGMTPGSFDEYFQPVIEGSYDGAIPFQWTFVRIKLSTPIYSAVYYSQSAYATLSANQSSPAFIEYANAGNVTWFDNTSIVNASGKSALYPVHLATGRPINRLSSFAGSDWATPSRPNLNFSNVFESDGITPSANQHIVKPGQIAKYAFTLNAPSNISNGTRDEYFQPVAEGSLNGLFNDTYTFLQVTKN